MKKNLKILKSVTGLMILLLLFYLGFGRAFCSLIKPNFTLAGLTVDPPEVACTFVVDSNATRTDKWNW